MIAVKLVAILLTSINQGLDVTLNVKAGATLHGETTLKASVTTDDMITQVEFYVAGELRDTKSSTPYEFKLDTINEDDGELSLKFTAYTSKGQKQERTVRVLIDNGLSKGPEFHTNLATQAYQDGKYDDAITEGRVALRSKTGYNPARVVLARAYAAKGILDKAQKYAEDALASEPNNPTVNSLAADLRLQRAFATLDRSNGDDALSQMADSLKSAIQADRAEKDRALEAFGNVDASNVAQFADLAFASSRYSTAYSKLLPVYAHSSNNMALTERIAFAAMRAAKYEEAMKILDDASRLGPLSAYANGLRAVCFSNAGNLNAAKRAYAEGNRIDSNDLGVRLAAASLAMRVDRTDTLSRMISPLSDQGFRPEVLTYQSMLANRTRDFGASRRYFRAAVQANPLSIDAYLEQGSLTLEILEGSNFDQEAKNRQLQAAQVWFEAANLARPESAEALLGLAICNSMQGKLEEADRYSKAAMAAAPTYPAGYFASCAIKRVISEATRNASYKLRQDANNLEREARQSGDAAKNAEAVSLGQKATEAMRTSQTYGMDSVNCLKLANQYDNNIQITSYPSLKDAMLYYRYRGRPPLLSPPPTVKAG